MMVTWWTWTAAGGCSQQDLKAEIDKGGDVALAWAGSLRFALIRSSIGILWQRATCRRLWCRLSGRVCGRLSQRTVSVGRCLIP